MVQSVRFADIIFSLLLHKDKLTTRYSEKIPYMLNCLEILSLFQKVIFYSYVMYIAAIWVDMQRGLIKFMVIEVMRHTLQKVFIS